MVRGRCAAGMACLSGWVALGGCAASAPKADPLTVGMEEHRRRFGEFELPRKVGSVVNIGVQLPTISPDGTQMLYLRSDLDVVSPMTLLGSGDPIDTPAEGTLSICLRPVAGTSPGQRITRERWAHSPMWSPAGRFMVYVAAEAGGTSIVRLDPASGGRDVLVDNDGVNCLPTFDGDDGTLLYCHGQTAWGPFEVRRQRVAEGRPVALTPRGMDCLLPVLSDGGRQVICGRVDGGRVDWALCTRESTTPILPRFSPAQRPVPLQAWAGISVPVSPDRRGFLFYDMSQDRVAVCHWADRAVRRHRSGSIAACWLANDAIALATADALFAVNVNSGVSISLLTGSWIPLRYVASTSKLYLLAKDGTSATRLAVYELAFRPAVDLRSRLR
ncbi:MAG: hypothetical protein HY718_13275 [Planctomycetes bacterium]|nr:hypothetical protein [Planctomycetota bacterium]